MDAQHIKSHCIILSITDNLAQIKSKEKDKNTKNKSKEGKSHELKNFVLLIVVLCCVFIVPSNMNLEACNRPALILCINHTPMRSHGFLVYMSAQIGEI